MKTYDRTIATARAAQLIAEQIDSAEPNKHREQLAEQRDSGPCCNRAAVNIRIVPQTPLEELLAQHPAPWRVEAHKAWRGAEPPDPVIYDALGYVVEICDDPAWAAAIVEAVNVAARVAVVFDEPMVLEGIVKR